MVLCSHKYIGEKVAVGIRISAPQGYGTRVVTTADHEPMEVHRAGVLFISYLEINLGYNLHTQSTRMIYHCIVCKIHRF